MHLLRPAADSGIPKNCDYTRTTLSWTHSLNSQRYQRGMLGECRTPGDRDRVGLRRRPAVAAAGRLEQQSGEQYTYCQAGCQLSIAPAALKAGPDRAYSRG